MLDDDWLRIQVYIPERVRWMLRSQGPDYLTDSARVRKILYWLTDSENEELLNEILNS